MEPTHIIGNILDLVVTSPSVNIVDLSIIPSVQYFSSDHFIVSFRSVIKFLFYVVSQGMCLIFLKLIWIVCVLIFWMWISLFV